MAVSVVGATAACPTDANADLGVVFLSLFAFFIAFDSILAAYTLRKTVLHAERPPVAAATVAAATVLRAASAPPGT